MANMRPYRRLHQTLRPLFVLLALAWLAGCSAPQPTPEAGLTPPSTTPPVVEAVDPAGAPTAESPPSPGLAITPSVSLPEDGPFPTADGALQTLEPVSPPQRARYALEAVFNYDRHHLSVTQTITYTNNSSDPLSHLPLMVEPAVYPNTFSLSSLQWGDGAEVQGASLERNRLTVPLPAPLSPGETVALRLQYELQLPPSIEAEDVRPMPFGYTARQTNLVDWYPYIPPYISGQGWLHYNPWYYGEHQVYELADFEVSLRLDGGRTDLKIAASAFDHPDGDWHRYQLEAARNFVWSVSHVYEVLTTTVGDVTVMSYAFPFQGDASQQVLDTTARALTLYNELFGAYPRPLISAVEADFLDGMEYEGLYFLSEGFYNLYNGSPAEYLTAIAAHETAHQWWYARVGNDQAREPWLDEALCTYAERLFYERYFPEALDWWWTVRVDYYEPRGPIDKPLYETSGFRDYRDAVYLNGAHFFEDLRQLAGDEAFFAFLGDYTAQNTGQLATAERFFTLLSAHIPQDITPLLQRYFAYQKLP